MLKIASPWVPVGGLSKVFPLLWALFCVVFLGLPWDRLLATFWSLPISVDYPVERYLMMYTCFETLSLWDHTLLSQLDLLTLPTWKKEVNLLCRTLWRILFDVKIGTNLLCRRCHNLQCGLRFLFRQPPASQSLYISCHFYLFTSNCF